MQTTTNYGFNIVEGTDIVNPLTQLNPNFTSLDADLKAVSDNTIDNATCIKTGTVHAVTRTNTDCNVFKFTATGNWNTGDTMTVDGSLVSVFNPDGTSPSDGCFVINTEVLAAIQGSRVTLYVTSPSTASNTLYDNTTSGLSATDVQDAIDEMEQEIKDTQWNIVNSSPVVIDLSAKTGKTLIDEAVAQGYIMKFISATGGQKLSDLPVIQAGLYVVYANTYYKQIHFYGANGTTRYIFNYESNSWTAF